MDLFIDKNKTMGINKGIILSNYYKHKYILSKLNIRNKIAQNILIWSFPKLEISIGSTIGEILTDKQNYPTSLYTEMYVYIVLSWYDLFMAFGFIFIERVQ